MARMFAPLTEEQLRRRCSSCRIHDYDTAALSSVAFSGSFERSSKRIAAAKLRSDNDATVTRRDVSRGGSDGRMQLLSFGFVDACSACLNEDGTL